jgi:hypothetical protein
MRTYSIELDLSLEEARALLVVLNAAAVQCTGAEALAVRDLASVRARLVEAMRALQIAVHVEG